MPFEHAKILSRPALAATLARVRPGPKVVFTNGCFDLLHAGHVDVLTRARALGDLLVLGLNDDASVARLKGPSRPVTPLAQRAYVLAGLAALRSMTILRFLNCCVCWSIAVPPGAKLSSLPALAGNATRLVAEKIRTAY